MTQLRRDICSTGDTKQTGHTPTTDKSSTSYEPPQSREGYKPRPVPELRVYDTHNNVASSGHYQYPPNDRNETATTGPNLDSATESLEEFSKHPWLVPHDAEYQKRAWHHSSFGMGSRVQDEWGFSSTGGSRSHSPNRESKVMASERVAHGGE